MFSYIKVLSSDFPGHRFRLRHHVLIFRNEWGLRCGTYDVSSIEDITLHPGRHADEGQMMGIAWMAFLIGMSWKSPNIHGSVADVISRAWPLAFLFLMIWTSQMRTHVVFSAKFKDGRTMVCKTSEAEWKLFRDEVAGD